MSEIKEYCNAVKKIAKDYNRDLEAVQKEWDAKWKAVQKRMDDDYADFIREQLFSDNPQVFFLWW